jgi:hypothetical protein
MRYSTERLGRLIGRLSTTPSLLYFEDASGTNAADLKQSILVEIDSMRCYLNREAIAPENIETFKHLVGQYQIFITSWMDKIYAVLGDFVKNEESALFLTFLELKTYLEEIQELYGDFFRFDKKAPKIYIVENRKRIKRRYPALARNLLKEKVTHQCAEIALKPLKDFIEIGDQKRITFRRLQYLKKYEDALFEFRNDNDNECKDRALLDLLFYLNYNSIRMFRFMIDGIRKELSSAKNNKEYLVKLHLYLKEVNKMKTHTLIFNENAKSLKEQIAQWIQEEISCHKVTSSIIQDSEPIRIPKDSIRKIELSTSVNVLSVIIRAAKETGLVVNTNNTEVYHTFAKYFRTKHSSNLSGSSLLKKSYSVSSGASKSANKLLKQMIEKIESYKKID